MAQIVIRNLESSVKERLRRKAKANGRSMEAEVRDILRDAVRKDPEAAGLGTRIAALFAGIGLEHPIEELRGHIVLPAVFDDDPSDDHS